MNLLIRKRHFAHLKIKIHLQLISLTQLLLKASNSVAYWNCSFPGKKKVFVAHDEAEKNAIVDAIYKSSYKDNLTIQEFIPGDDSYMRVLNAYVGKDGKVKLMSLGNPILEEHSPEGIGSYAAIINTFR